MSFFCEIYIMKPHHLLFIFLLSAFPIEAQHTFFYRCDSLVDVYYATQNYEQLVLDWDELPPDSIACLDHTRILGIMIDKNDTLRARRTIDLLIRKYGFDVKTYLSLTNIDFCFDNARADSLYQVWYKAQGEERLEANRMVKAFRDGEYFIYQTYMKSDKFQRIEKHEEFLTNLDSLFEDLMTICEQQGFLPNMETNGYGNDVSLPLMHILAVSNAWAEKWCRIYPYIHTAFKKGLISNSYFFIYDRETYTRQQCQCFGTFDERVPFCESLCGEDEESLKMLRKTYLIDQAYSNLQRNKYWLTAIEGQP